MPGLIFDCDGVLAETELDGHLPAFNQTFTEFGLPLHWDEAEYAERLKIGGGKERMASALTPAMIEGSGMAAEQLLATLHARKTELFLQRVEAGALPTRPGITALINAALDAGWDVAVASTSAEKSVKAVLRHAVGEQQAARCRVFAGDIVAHKKPAPDIYQLVVTTMNLDPDDCLVVEDSSIGLRAAQAAGLTTLVTMSHFTTEEDFSGAAAVLTHLGDPEHPAQVVQGDLELPDGTVGLPQVQQLIESNR